MKYLACLVLALVCLYYVECATTSTRAPTTTVKPTTGSTSAPTTKQTTQKPSSTPVNPVTTQTPGPVTTLTPAQQCKNASSDCETCVKVGSVQCLWCESKKSCMLKEHVIPTSECGLSDAKWAVCWVNYEALIIACSVIGGILILGLTICICCCCCCRKNNDAKFAKDDAKYERKKADMKTKHDERRAERKAKNDEIRRKYGLIKEDNPYQRFGEEN